MMIRINGCYLIYILSYKIHKGQEEIMMTSQEKEEDNQIWVIQV